MIIDFILLQKLGCKFVKEYICKVNIFRQNCYRSLILYQQSIDIWNRVGEKNYINYKALII